MPYCPKCKYEYHEGIIICPDCSEELIKDTCTDSNENKNRKNRRNIKKNMIWILGILGAIVLTFLSSVIPEIAKNVKDQMEEYEINTRIKNGNIIDSKEYFIDLGKGKELLISGNYFDAIQQRRKAREKSKIMMNKSYCPFEFVLVYDVKRFGRVDNDEAGFYRYQLRRNGIEVIYVSEGFSGDDTDDLIRPVKQWQARQKLKDLSKVTIRGLVSRTEGGWWMGGSPPYGYDLAYYNGSGDFICIVRFMEDGSRQMLDQDGKLIRIVSKGDGLTLTKKDRCRLVQSSPERIRVIKDIFDWYVVEGLGYKGIVDRLNRTGVPSAHSGSWALPQ